MSQLGPGFQATSSTTRGPAPLVPTPGASAPWGGGDFAALPGRRGGRATLFGARGSRFGTVGPADRDVEEIQEAALAHFLRHPSDPQKQFLGQNLNTAYFLSVLSIDPEAAALVREIASGQVVFLDTNFVYRVLGIQGPRHVRAARTILDTTKGVGYRCCVTPWTVEEFGARPRPSTCIGTRCLDQSTRRCWLMPHPTKTLSLPTGGKRRTLPSRSTTSTLTGGG